MMRLCDEALQGGSSILMFPEGTRSATGRLRSFKPGAFQIAVHNQVPVQPILIRGTSEALPKRGFILQGRHAITVEILAPIPPEQFAGTEPEELMARVQGLFLDELEQPTPAR